jgi:hypothetical protein
MMVVPSLSLCILISMSLTMRIHSLISRPLASLSLASRRSRLHSSTASPTSGVSVSVSSATPPRIKVRRILESPALIGSPVTVKGW